MEEDLENFLSYVKYIHHNDLENKIETNDTTSVNYKLLTSGYWKLKRIKYFVDNVYKYDESLKEIVNEIEFKFSKDGVLEVTWIINSLRDQTGGI